MLHSSIQLTDFHGPIIIVDDNLDDMRTAERCYQRSKLKNPMICLGGGQELLDYLYQVEANQLPMPALVLLDIRMPCMDGFEVLQAVRAQDSFRAVPVVMMLSNSDYPKDVEKAAELGANGYREKPSTIAQFVAFFDALLPELILS